MANENKARNLVSEFAKLISTSSVASLAADAPAKTGFDVQAGLALVAEAQGQVQESAFELRTATANLSAAQAAVEAKTTEIGTLNASIKTLEETSLKNVSDLRDANAAVASAEGDKTTLADEKSALQTQVDELTVKVTELTTQVDTLTTEKTDLESKLNVQNAEELGATDGVKGDIEADAAELTPEQIAAKLAAIVVDGGVVDLAAEYQKLITLSTKNGGADSRRLEAFVNANPNILGSL